VQRLKEPSKIYIDGKNPGLFRITQNQTPRTDLKRFY
jgi:hypothetical protein